MSLSLVPERRGQLLSFHLQWAESSLVTVMASLSTARLETCLQAGQGKGPWVLGFNTCDQEQNAGSLLLETGKLDREFLTG